MGDTSVSIKLGEAILAINKDAKYAVRGNKFPIEWMDGTTPIVEADITAKQIELQADYDAKEYQRLREPEYPSIAELVVALYDDDDKAAIEKRRADVKAKYPKP